MGASISGYLGLGWRIFPCHSIENRACTCGRVNCESPGKHPRVRHGVNEGTTDIDRVKAWYANFPSSNWGLSTGRESGVFVVDVDERKGGFDSWDSWVEEHIPGGLPATLTSHTGGGGRHYFFKYPSDEVDIGNKVNWLPGVDIRSNGGYVILAPGRHISGGQYAWENWGHSIADAPADLITALVSGSSGGISDTKLGTLDQLLNGIDEGGRDDTIFRAACRLRRQLGDDARGAATVLILQMAANSTPPFPEDEALAKIEQAWKQDRSDEDIFTDSADTDEEDPIFHLTDDGNSNRFVRTYGDNYRFVEDLGGWHRWTDIGWVRVSENIVKRTMLEIPKIILEDAKRVPDVTTRQRFRRFSLESESNARVSSALNLAKTHPTIFKTSDEFDSHPEQIACMNGMLDLRTGEIRRFGRDDLFTKNTGVVYDPDFTLKAWDDFLLTATDGDDELIRYLQMAAGYTLTGLTKEECFFILSGPTASGKSTYLDGLVAAMGSYHDTTPAETFMQKYGAQTAGREEFVKFAGTRLIVTSELPEGKRFDDSLIKRLTGGDRISARLLYSESFNFKPQFKLWMATNHDPVTQDDAMFRRIKRVPFSHTIPVDKRDGNLKPLIADPEVGGRAVLAWAVKGAQEYLKEGRLVTPHSVQMSTDRYRQEQDMFTQFIQEVLERHTGSVVKLTEAYARYKIWAQDANEHPLRRPQFVQKLAEQSIEVGGATNTQRVLLNVRIRTDTSIPFVG